MRPTILLSAAAILLASFAVQAEQITYTESAVASGSLGGVNFTNSFFTLTGTADTTAVVETSPGIFKSYTTITGTVSGLGSFALTPSGDFFNNENYGTVGLSGPAGIDLLDITNPTLASYDLQSGIGPLTGTAYTGSYDVYTNAGDLFLTGASDATFVATTSSVTPEPSSFALLGTGLLGLAGIMRRSLHGARSSV